MAIKRISLALAFGTLSISTPVTPVTGRVIGMNQPAEPVTAARIARLPAKDRTAWSAYLLRSQAQMSVDKAALAAERRAGAPVPPQPATGNGEKTMPLDRDAAWYAGPEARHVADVILSFQTPAGGWGKNQPRDGALRQPGQFYVSNNANPAATAGDFDAAEAWHYVGTIDNDATITETRFLAKVAAALSGAAGDRYRAGAIRGLRYLLAAQYPNGGWPQVWPLEGGYHDAITLNDNAMAQVLTLMTDAGAGRGDLAMLPTDLKRAAAAATARGIACLLRMQVVVNGRKTGWGQQHDALTLRITSARNYEPAALAAPESAAILRYLMRLQRTPTIAQAVEPGIAWLKESAIVGQAWRDAGDGQGRRLIPDPAARMLWARFYTLDGGRPIFGDRDKTLHDDVMEISPGRRRGYAWFGTGPQSALAEYAAWSARR
ncbi:pectate lyase [uncultured Sphingomonas sp.]|uniref:pectate lyase n=1 Tax=uncultured Sphingomonas sp. TaxID=158754 RepID=UPI0025EE1179|nr:pectate lyase [uncultured Sphingomonas sp.]